MFIYTMDPYDICEGNCGNMIPVDQYFCGRPECIKDFAVKMAKSVRVSKEVAQLPVAIIDKFAPYESIYELTLTVPTDDAYSLRQGLLRILQSKMFEIKGFIACIELTKQGLPHIHALLFSNKKYLDSTKIKTMYEWRYELKRVRLPGNYYDYINKEKNNPTVIDYCAQKGIPQFWESE